MMMMMVVAFKISFNSGPPSNYIYMFVFRTDHNPSPTRAQHDGYTTLARGIKNTTLKTNTFTQQQALVRHTCALQM